MKEPIELPIARLVGIIENQGEHTACSLIFKLETENGRMFNMAYAALIEALRFAQAQSIMPALSESWWARIGEHDGCAF